MYTCAVRLEIASLSAYVPGMSIAEIQEKYGLAKVVKMASNENPLGVSPLVKEALGLHAGTAFRYPQGGNPRLVAALARTHGVSPDQVVVGNGSDEIIDMLIRMLLVPGKHSVVCFDPCFSIYPIQAQVCGVEVRRQPLNPDFSRERSTTHFRSLCGTGRVSEVTDTEEKRRALDAISLRFDARCPRPAPDAALARVNILRIDVESLTCRHKDGSRRKDKE